MKLESAEIDRILLKLAADEGLDDTTRKAITAIIRDYTGASMTDLMRVAKDGFAISETLERKLMGEDNGAHDVHVQLTLVDPKGD